MSFPPGLIPQLVREKNVTDPPYSPLSPLDIEALGLPPSAAPDAYLASRLEKFYAELQVSHIFPILCKALITHSLHVRGMSQTCPVHR